MNLKYLLWACALFLCTACAGLKVKDQSYGLTLALEQYGADLRWGRYRQAYIFHVNRDGQQPQFSVEQLENFSVTSFKPSDPILNADATEAVIPVEIDYYNEQYGRVLKFKDTQKWWFNIKEKKWYTESDFPVLK